MENISTELLRYIIKNEVEKKIESLDIAFLTKELDSLSLKILSEIQKILQRHTVYDNDFEVVENIVCLFEKYDLNCGVCHDFG